MARYTMIPRVVALTGLVAPVLFVAGCGSSPPETVSRTTTIERTTDAPVAAPVTTRSTTTTTSTMPQ